jgi:hypothetical protein
MKHARIENHLSPISVEHANRNDIFEDRIDERSLIRDEQLYGGSASLYLII